jgi:hypothetical protein
MGRAKRGPEDVALAESCFWFHRNWQFGAKNFISLYGIFC